MPRTAIQKWDTHEVALVGGEHENPFTDVELTASFAHEDSGTRIHVDGFYDGRSGDASDGNRTGQPGHGTGANLWRLRLAPFQEGHWTYQTSSNDPTLDGHSGELDCIPVTRRYLHGPLEAVGHHFQHVDGTRRYLTSTRVSCMYADDDVHRRLADFCAGNGLNRVFFIMGGVHSTIGGLYGPGNGKDRPFDYSRYDLQRFRRIDALIDTLRQADVIASPYFYYFNDGAQNPMTLDEDRAFIRYGMARFGAYCNVAPCLSNQLEGKFTKGGPDGDPYDPRNYEWGNTIGAYLKSRSVFGAPVTVHNPLENQSPRAVNPSFYTVLRDWQFPWADYMLRQMQLGALGGIGEFRDDVSEQSWAGAVPGPNGTVFQKFYNPRAFANQNFLLTELRRFGIPVINEEPGYEMKGMPGGVGGHLNPKTWNSQTSESLLSTLWSGAMAGAYGMWGNLETYEMGDPLPGMENSVFPQYYRVLHDVMTRCPYWEMEPANDRVSPSQVEVEEREWRTNFCYGRDGGPYIVYSEYGQQATMQLGAGSYRVTRINPRRGTELVVEQAATGNYDFSLPRGEWVLLFEPA